MAKITKSELLESGLEILGRDGAKALTTRGIESAVGATHGTVRYHFGGYAGYLVALADHLLAIDMPRAGESPDDAIDRWLGPQRTQTVARYELALIATRDPVLAERITGARTRVAEAVSSATGLPAAEAHAVMTALDGLILDALLRGEYRVDPAPILDRFGLS